MKEDNADNSYEFDFPKVSNVSIKKNPSVIQTLRYSAPLTELEPASPDPLTILYPAEPETNDQLTISEKSLENRSNSKGSHSNVDLSQNEIKQKNITKKNLVSEEKNMILESLLNTNLALKKLNPPINQIVEKDYIKMQPDEISLTAGETVCVVASDGNRYYGIVDGAGMMGFFHKSCLKDNSLKMDVKNEILNKESSSSFPISETEEVHLEDVKNDSVLANTVNLRDSSKVRNRVHRNVTLIEDPITKIERALSTHTDYKKLDRPTFYIVKIPNTAKLEDELDLNINDKVCVYARNQTTCLGYFQKTGKVGIFPNECILEPNSPQDSNILAVNSTETFKYSLAGRRIKSLRKQTSIIELRKNY